MTIFSLQKNFHFQNQTNNRAVNQTDTRLRSPQKWFDNFPIAQTKAGEDGSVLSLVIKGMGMDPSLFVIDPGMAVFWDLMGQKSLEELLSIIDNCWRYFDQFSEEELKPSAGQHGYVQLYAYLCDTVNR